MVGFAEPTAGADAHWEVGNAALQSGLPMHPVAPPSTPAPQRQARGWLVALVLAAGSAQAAAQIYTGVAASGTILLSNHASDGVSEVLVALPASAEVAAAAPDVAASAVARNGPSARRFDVEIRAAARRHDLPEGLLTAVVAVESGFDPRAVSPKGARGLMQLMPATARRFGVKDVFAVPDNLHGGAACGS
jgi:soluble lytic murein transglycosylase-like protein